MKPLKKTKTINILSKEEAARFTISLSSQHKEFVLYKL